MPTARARLVEAFHDCPEENKINDFSVEAVKETGCHGFCEQGPLVVIEPQGTFYTKVKPKDIPAIIAKSIVRAEDHYRAALFTDPVTNKQDREIQ